MRVGLIGAGWIAEEHVAILRRLEDVELVAVADVNEERARELGGGAATYTDWHELLERESPDAVFVCTPPMLHREMTVEELGRGINDFLYKPVARGRDDER